MLVRIINSGSDGNCTILKDSKENELMLDCGLPYEIIASQCSLRKLNAVLGTHAHRDHLLSFDKFEKFGFETFSPKNIQDGKIIDLLNWKIMPMKLVHNVECFGFLIFNKIENKKIVYCTDTTYLPRVGNADLFILDCNYDEEIVFDKMAKGEEVNIGYRNHCSTQKIVEYIHELGFKPKNLVAYHVSNSQLQSIQKIQETLSPLVENLYIAKPNTEIIV